MNDTYELTGLEATSRKLLEEVSDRFSDPNDVFDRTEWMIMRVMHTQYAWEVTRDNVVRIVGAMFNITTDTSYAQKRLNTGFRRLVRGGYLYSKTYRGTRNYAVQLDREKAARKAAV